MWPAAQSADTGVGDAVRPGRRQGQRPRATWEDTRVEKQVPQGKEILSLFSPQGSRGDTVGCRRESRWQRQRDPGGRVDPSPSHPPASWVGQRPPPQGGGLVAEGSKVRGRAGVLNPGFGKVIPFVLAHILNMLVM